MTMKKYSAHWAATILAAIALHVAAAVAFPQIVPLFKPAPKVQTVADLDWVDVDIADDSVVTDAEAIPADVAKTVPTFDAEALHLPGLSTPETFKPPELPTQPPKLVEQPKPLTKPVETPKPPAQAKPSADKPDKPTETQQDDKSLMARPPITVKEVFPDKGSGLGYKGYVSIAVRIGKDGKIHSTEILQSSGRYFVDEIALKAAAQWTFKPALDQIGRPMECDKIITFDFRKFS